MADSPVNSPRRELSKLVDDILTPLKKSSTEDEIRRALHRLSKASNSSPNAAALFAKKGAVPLIVAILKPEHGPEIQAIAASTLLVFAKTSQPCFSASIQRLVRFVALLEASFPVVGDASQAVEGGTAEFSWRLTTIGLLFQVFSRVRCLFVFLTPC